MVVKTTLEQRIVAIIPLLTPLNAEKVKVVDITTLIAPYTQSRYNGTVHAA